MSQSASIPGIFKGQKGWEGSRSLRNLVGQLTIWFIIVMKCEVIEGFQTE